MQRKRRVYTRRGDLGETGLHGGPRVAKDSPRIETVGALDELNASIGLAREELESKFRAKADSDMMSDQENAFAEMDDVLRHAQGRLFEISAEFASPDPVRFGVRTLTREHVAELEPIIDATEDVLPPQSTFLLPSGTRPATTLHLARTICRRAERQVIRLMREVEEDVSRIPLAYLNRLADLLYVFARRANQLAGKGEEPWTPPSRGE